MAQSQPRSAHPKRKRPAAWGTIRRRESGKFEAFYRMEGRTIRAPRRFDSDAEAQAWLATERAAHVTGTWIDPERVSVAPASAPGVLTLASTFEALCEALIAEEAAFAEARPAYLPRRAGPLLGDGAVAGGLSARFVWLVAEDPDAADAPRPSAEQPPVYVPLSQWDGVRYVDALPEMDAAHEADTRAAHRGEREPINSRVLLNRAIIAIALANMAGRSHLTAEDWHLAGAVLAHSLDTLDTVAEALAEPDDGQQLRSQRVEQRMRERLSEMQAQGIPFYEARRKLSRAQGDHLTELLHAGKFAPW